MSKDISASGITIPNFKLCYRAIAIKTVWYWHKKYKKRVKQNKKSRNESTQLCLWIGPSTSIFDKGDKNI
jgi:hypothetical protein